MENEKRLIDANAYAESWKKVPDMDEPFTARDVIEDVMSFPTVDAVEVVRCKDCAHAEINENHPNRPLICFLTRMCGTVRPDWFCGDGERREGE